jgi:hypothetical protein
MSEIFPERDGQARAVADRQEQAQREIAACYARVLLGSEDGQRVLADLRKKFGLQRLVFKAGTNGRYDYLDAAIRDGERRVMSEIEGALLLAARE